MNDMSKTIIAKSDQINAVDLRAGPRTVTVREVRIKGGEDQPVSVMIEGDKKAFRPCLGVRRLMVRVWGPDASKYIGESMTLFCDPKVTWAGKEEGGIRISHMTGLKEKIVEFMRVNRSGTKAYEILPLKMENQQTQKQRQTPQEYAEELLANIAQAPDAATLDNIERKAQKALAKMSEDDSLKSLHDGAIKAFADKRQEFGSSDPFAVQD